GGERLPGAPGAVGEEVRPVELADVARVSDQARRGIPDVELARGRLHRERQRLVLEVERNLVRRARRGRGERPAHEGLDRSMQVAAHDALDVPMPADDFGELAGV